MLPRRERGRRMRVMKVIRRGDVDHVNPIVGEHRLHRLGTPAAGPRPRSFAARAPLEPNDSVDLDAEPAERIDVDQADESGTDDRGAQLSSHRCSHAQLD